MRNLELNHESLSQGIGSTALKSNTFLRRPFWIRQCPSPRMLRLLILHLVVFVHLKMGLFFIGKFHVSEWQHKTLWLKKTYLSSVLNSVSCKEYFSHGEIFSMQYISAMIILQSRLVSRLQCVILKSFSSIQILFANAMPAFYLYVHFP